MTARKYGKSKGVHPHPHPLETAHAFYEQMVVPLPESVILPATKQLQALIALFGSDAELVVCKIIEAIGDKTSAHLKVTRMANELYKGLTQGASHQAPRMLDYTIVVEQAALDIRDLLEQYGVYIQGRWLPYVYEHIVPGGGLMLQKPLSFQQFIDDIAWAAGISDYHPLGE